MALSATFSGYMARQFLYGIAAVFFALAALILVFDAVELSRRAAGADQADTMVIVRMALFHLPYLAERVIPYAVLIGVILTLVRLTRSGELIVARAAGVSAWQFLFPGIALAALIGVLAVAVYNPFAAAMLSRFEQMDGKYIRGQTSNLVVSTSGLWLRQADDAGESVIHALRISQPGLVLHDVIIFRYEGRDHFVQRIDAQSAQLKDGYWLLHEALITGPDQPALRSTTFELQTELTIGRIQDSFASPETMSFWEIPAFINLLEQAGFSAVKHIVHWHAVLASPLLLCGMVLIAAAFSLRFSRLGRTGWSMAAGIAAGFGIYAFSDIVLALGISASLPALLAGWAPAGFAAILGTAMLLYVEDR